MKTKEDADMNLDGKVSLGSLVVFGERGDGIEMQLVIVGRHEDIDEELGEQWEMYERVLLERGGSECAEDEKTLRRSRDV